MQQRLCATFEGVPALGCMPRKTPLQQSANNQHKAKIEPGKSFINSEPHRRVKFLGKNGTSIQFSVKFKGSLLQFSPGEKPMPNGHRLCRVFSGKASPIEPRGSIKRASPFNNAWPVVWFIAHQKKNIKAIPAPLLDEWPAHMNVGKKRGRRSARSEAVRWALLWC